MISIRSVVAGGLLSSLAVPAPALASESFEFWLSPSASTDIDDDTAVEFATSQRWRSAADGGADTYFARIWIKQKIATNATLSAGAEQRVNDGGNDERRFMQQISASHGVLRKRLRLEQRFVENRGGRMGLRLRPRLGVEFPVSKDGRLTWGKDAELAWTLRSTGPGGDTGITGLRTQIGFGYELSDNIDLSLVYVRQQDFEDNAPDEIAHAPSISIDFSF